MLQSGVNLSRVVGVTRLRCVAPGKVRSTEPKRKHDPSCVPTREVPSTHHHHSTSFYSPLPSHSLWQVFVLRSLYLTAGPSLKSFTSQRLITPLIHQNMFASLVSSVHPESTSSSTFPSLPSTVRRPSSSSTSWPGIQTRIPSHHLKAAREQHQQHRHRSSHFLASFGFPAGSRPRRFIVRLALLVTLIVTLAWFIATGEIKQAWGPALSSLSPTVKSSGYPVSRVLEAAGEFVFSHFFPLYL